MRRSALCWIWFISLSAVACSDAPTATGPVPAGGFTPVVSNTVAAGGVMATGAVAANVSALEPVAFVSLTPGAMPDGTTGTIRDLRSGASRPVTLVDGGFDPVAIPAAAGDTLAITIVLSGGGVSLAKAVVPIRRPPRVVRTSPASGRTDVAINASVAVIFSEPVDLATVTSSTVRLLQNGQPVAGALRPLAGSSVGIEFVPAAPLASTTAYTLSVGDAITDLTGDRLAEALVSDFVTTTATTPPPPPPPPPILTPQLTGTLAFVSTRDGNAEIYTINADGTDLRRLTSDPAEDTDPAWSPDGTRVAFTSTRDGTSNIYIMNADGSNVVRRTTTGDWNDYPAWSPDGLKIAFSSLRNGDYGLYVTGVEGDWANATPVGHPRGWNSQAAWSPDGTRILFVSDWRVFDTVFDLYVMNADGSNISGLVQPPFISPDVPVFIFRPAWSPDGRRVAMFTCRDLYSSETCYANGSVSITNADGSGMHALVDAGGGFPAGPPLIMGAVAWSQDGSTIVYSTSSCQACQPSLRYITADGVTSGLVLANAYSPSWRW